MVLPYQDTGGRSALFPADNIQAHYKLEVFSAKKLCVRFRGGLKGIIKPFPKICSYSVETVDKVAKWHDPTHFVSQLRYLQMPGPQS